MPRAYQKVAERPELHGYLVCVTVRNIFVGETRRRQRAQADAQQKYVSGLPTMTGRDRKRVNGANEVVRIITKLCELCTEIGVPWVIENPRSSLIWQMPTMKKLAAKSKAEFCRYDYCQFGSDWQKPTVLMAWGDPLLKIHQVR